MTLEKLQVIIEAQTKAFRDEMERMKKQMDTATSHVEKKTNVIHNLFKKLGKIIAITTIIKSLVSFGKQSIDLARTVQASTQQIERLLGDNAQSFKNWAKMNANSFNMAQAEALQYGATYSNLLSSFLGSTSDIEAGTTELLKASAIIQSNTGRTMEDVMDRIRSGLLGNTEAIEDLGINVNVAMLQSTDAFKRFAGSKSWNQLDFQTQQQIRLMAILEQTSKKFGDEVSKNTNTSIQQLNATIKDISLNIGNALLPMFNAIIPVVQTIANKIKEVTAVFAAFMNALFGKEVATSTSAITNSTNAMDGYSNAMDEASKSANKMKGSLAGFDELNVISSPSSSDSGASGSGGSNGSLFSNASTDVDTSGIDKITEKVNKFKDFMDKNGAIIQSIIAGIISSFVVLGMLQFGPSIIAGVLSVISVFTSWQAGIGTTISMITGLSIPILTLISMIGLVVAAITYLWQTSDDFRNKVSKAVDNLMAIVETLYNDYIKPIFDEIVKICERVWHNGIEPLWQAWCEFVEIVVGVVLDLWNAVSPILNTLLEILGPLFQMCLQMTGGIVSETFTLMLNAITFAITLATGLIEGFLATFDGVFDGIMKILDGIIKFVTGVFTGDWDKAWQGVRDIFGGIFETLEGLIKTPINAVIGIINGAISGINNIGFKIPDWVPLIGGKKFSVDIPKMNYLAEGGIASKATLGVFGEAGTEAVIPLKKNTQGIEMIANKLLENMPVNQGGGTYLIQLVLEDGTVLAKKMIKNIKEYEIMTGKPAF